jgi:mannose-6-phosphate isomerase-like protein (cupin superfamily)
MTLRRVVTIEDPLSRSTILSDGPIPRSTAFQHVPGFVTSLAWATRAQASVPTAPFDAAANTSSWVPEPGGTCLLVITFPPDSIYQADEFDPVAAGAEHAAVLPGLAERFEPDNPGMHTTDTIDYGVVLEGSIVLELDGGQQIAFGKHDIVVQQGTRHAWRNPGNEPATVLFVLVGAQRRPLG